MRYRWGTTCVWLAKLLLAACLPLKISAYSCVETGRYLPTVYEHQLSSYHNKENGYILSAWGKKIRGWVCSGPCYHCNYELCLQSDTWTRVKCDYFLVSLLFAHCIWLHQCPQLFSPVLSCGGVNGNVMELRLWNICIILAHVLPPPCMPTSHQHLTLQILIGSFHLETATLLL